MRGSSVCVLYHSEREEASGDSGDVVGGGAWTVVGRQDNGPAGGTSSSEWGENINFLTPSCFSRTLSKISETSQAWSGEPGFFTR